MCASRGRRRRKAARIRAELTKLRADALVGRPHAVAWAFNIRAPTSRTRRSRCLAIVRQAGRPSLLYRRPKLAQDVRRR